MVAFVTSVWMCVIAHLCFKWLVRLQKLYIKTVHLPSVFCVFHRSQVDFRKLKRNGVVIAEALARYMYNLSDKVDKCMETECVFPSTETMVFIIYLLIFCQAF